MFKMLGVLPSSKEVSRLLFLLLLIPFSLTDALISLVNAVAL